MYLIRNRGQVDGDGNKRVMYFTPSGPIFWESRAIDAEPPMDAAIRSLDEARAAYGRAAADYRRRFHGEPACLEIVGCQYHLL